MNHMTTMTLLAALTALLVWAGTALAGQNGFVMALVLAGVWTQLLTRERVRSLQRNRIACPAPCAQWEYYSSAPALRNRSDAARCAPIHNHGTTTHPTLYLPAR
jgi:hypothetical protein